MTSFDTMNLDTEFTTISGIPVKYSFNADYFKIGEVEISPHFFKLLYEAAIEKKVIRLGFDNGLVIFTEIPQANP